MGGLRLDLSDVFDMLRAMNRTVDHDRPTREPSPVFGPGIRHLDEALGGGFGPGVHVVLARHGAGSTALALQVAEGAIAKGLRVLLVGDRDLLDSAPRRLAALRAGVALYPDGSLRDAPEGLLEAWSRATHGLVSFLSTTTASNPPPVDVGEKTLLEVEERRPAVVVIDGIEPSRMVVPERGKALLAAARAAADRWSISVLVTGHLLGVPRPTRHSYPFGRPTLEKVGDYREVFESEADTMLLMDRPSADLFDDSDMAPEGVAATLVRRGQAPVEVDFNWSRARTRFV